MHFARVISVFAQGFVSVMFLGACSAEDADSPIADPVEVAEQSLQACGSGLDCSLSNVSGSTYCQSGAQKVYCCSSGKRIVNGVCQSCTETCTWENRCKATGSGHDDYRVKICRNSCTGATRETQTCCWTTSPGKC